MVYVRLMSHEATRDRGKLFETTEKKKPSEPDFFGDCTIDGTAYEIRGWRREDQLTISIAPPRGDRNTYPPDVFKGALEAAPLLTAKLLLVGDTNAIKLLLPNPIPPNIELVHASESVGMDEKPLDAYRKKKDSSIIVGAQLVKDGRARAFVSAGNTGAASATCLLIWRQVEKVHRPAIATQIPNNAAIATSSRNRFIGTNSIRGIGFKSLARAETEPDIGRQTAATRQNPANTISTDPVSLAIHRGTKSWSSARAPTPLAKAASAVRTQAA